MRVRKLICAAACVLAINGVAGCRGAEEKEITLILKAPSLTFRASAIDDNVVSSYDLMREAGAAFAEQYTDARVTISVIQYEGSKEIENIDECYGTDNAADVLMNDYFTMESHIHSGNVVPLDDIISGELRSDIAHVFWEQSMISGKTYMMPYLYRQNVLAYNNDLFMAAGLEEYVSDGSVIQTWSLDQWESILAALRSSMPDTAYPLMMYSLDSHGDTHVMCYIRSRGSSFFDDDMRLALETPEGIAGLQWIKDCVDKGYMPDNAEEIDLLSNYDLFVNGQLAIFVANASSEDSLGLDYGLVNFPTPDGGCSTNFMTGFEVFDNGDKDRLQAAKAFVKFIYESEYLDYSTAGIPCSRNVCERYPEHVASMRKYIDNAATAVNFTGGNPNWLGVRNVFYLHIQDLLSGRKSASEVARELDADTNNAIEAGFMQSVLHE